MVREVSPVIYSGEDVLTFQKRVVGKDFFERGTGTEQLQHIGDPNPETTDARAPTALAFLNRDPTQPIRFHMLEGQSSTGRRRAAPVSKSPTRSVILCL